MFNLPLLEDVDFAALAKVLSASFVVLFIALLFLVVKRLYFHPLSKVPGPKLAAATGWYGFYYDVIRSGAYSHRYPEFHERYSKSLGGAEILPSRPFTQLCIVASPIIRISPNHVHIKDADFFNEYVSITSCIVSVRNS